MTVSRYIALILSFSAIGCGDFKAPDKCETLVDAICQNVAYTCFPPIDIETCQAEFDKNLDCSNAIDVSDDYEQCLDDVQATDECLPLAGLPASCADAVIGLTS